MDIINLDNNASTPVHPEVWEAMRPFMLADAGNPASSHALGRRARRALEDARETVAQLLDAQADEVLFTSGATEANNLAIFGLAGTNPGTIFSSAIEHPCVVEPVQQLTKRGFAHRPLPVSRQGIVELFPDSWPSDTRLACLMLANHETGAIQPVGELATLLGGRTPFHCDAAAAAGKMPIAFRKLGVTSLTITAHKFHGPKGIGALLLRKDARLTPLFFGGHQQHAKRPGTEPVALAVGLAAALNLAVRQMETHWRHCLALRQRFLQLLRAGADPVVLNGRDEGGLPHTLNISFPGCAADVILMNLDLAGVACATGSACSSGSLLPSPVLQAMGVPTEVLRSAMRFSISGLTTMAEIEDASQRIIMVANKLRDKSTTR
jgi:cysteine desulfurase